MGRVEHPEASAAASLREALGPVAPWRARAVQLTAALARHEARRGLLDIQRLFNLFPPDSATGESLFRLAEALPRTPDAAGGAALLADRVPLLRRGPLARAALVPVRRTLDLVGGQFVFAQTIEDALAAVGRQAALRYSFDMLGEGARTRADADANLASYRRAVQAAAGHPAGRSRFGISVKLSSIHPRYDAASYRLVRPHLFAALKELCAIAAEAGIGLTIDAEESERAALQVDLFAALAEEPAFLQWEGLGLAVQAYRTGAGETLEAVLALAARRHSRGGGRVCVRLVKGAYWDAEVKRAQELGLAAYPVFTDKRTTDLSYLACARRLLEGRDAVYPQFATHNPATLGCVLALAQNWDGFECQRLHGMGAGLEEALAGLAPRIPLRVYAPVGRREELLAYLVRRLLENAASTSYVRQAARGFSAADALGRLFDFTDAASAPHPFPLPQEIQMPERLVARGHDLAEPRTLEAFAAEVASLPRNWRAAPLVSGRRLHGVARPVASPARPQERIGEVVDASANDVRSAIDSAFAMRREWDATPVGRRASILERLADLLEQDTPRLCALCVWEAGKTLPDALADLREAVDFCRYYAQQAREAFAPRELRGPVGERNELRLHGRGVFACISPWNFPVAIFTGQVAAALVAGNTVVAKPAEQTPLAAFRIAELALEAGVPAAAFHLLPGDGATGQAIVSDPRIAGVAFTGGTETARHIQRALVERGGPLVPLIAETGGLNAMIADSTALAEQVVDAVIASAFRSAGQRCSSLRMLYVQDEAFDRVAGMLGGAMRALRVGDPADPSTDIGPLIDADARRALSAYVEELRATRKIVGEAPPVPSEGNFLAPVAFEVGSIRDLPGERFGPVLHVARFAIDELDRVLDDIEATGYGLTMGLQTRVDARAEHVRRRAPVGNLYVNRNTIGAVVGVQPFGGEGLSGTGPKAGGPHYLLRFATERVCTVNTAAAGGDVQLMTAGS
ncbi:MAG TPA: bifunctional proline dehydrogenase/L-glutamate gamma-semialdehyde dehydrogenase PutA [Burkholderiales bacterium]|nr:bifunctional proline dehydrogenase/L-glutamate gamma-semialdehyde dehydrogenase PutA [Burkholderiales bacterium]